MTTTRHSITRQDHPEAFAPYHALPDTLAQGRSRYGPSHHLSLPRFSDSHTPLLMNQGSINDLSFNRQNQPSHLSNQSFHFNFAPTNGLPRPPFTPLGSPGIWSSPPPPMRQVAPLPPAQGYGMGQDLTGVGGQAKRRRVHDDNTPTSISTSASGSPAGVSRHSRLDLESRQTGGKVDPFMLSVHASERLPHDITGQHEQADMPVSFDNALSDPLLDDTGGQGVSEWAGMGDFALFNDIQHEATTEASSAAEWNNSFMSFTDDDAGAVAGNNNLFDLKEESLFSPLDRTSSAPAPSDLSLGLFKRESSGSKDSALVGLHCNDGVIPAVTTGRPLLGTNPDIPFEAPISHADFTDPFSQEDHDLARLNSSGGEATNAFSLSGNLSEVSSVTENTPSGRCSSGALGSHSLAHMSKLTEAEAGGGSNSDASTAASVSDFSSAGLMPMSKPGGLGSLSTGLGDMKSGGKIAASYNRSNLHVSQFAWRSLEGTPQEPSLLSGGPVSNDHAHRPDLSQQTLEELNDISCFKNDERYKKLIVDYTEGISFPLGEGGRELLRACLNVKGCKGRQLQGASVPALLALAKTWGLWDVAIRIKVERSCGQLCPQHDAFVKFKANQSQMRKYVKKEYMVTERDNQGCLSGIIYDERRKITLGKEGRESLRTQLRRLHDKHAGKMDDLLEKHGFKYSELRNATVQQLSRMAYVCNLWDKVVAACRKQEEKRDYRNRDGSRTSARTTKDYGPSIPHDPSTYSNGMPPDLDPNHGVQGGLEDAWKSAYHPSDLQPYGDLPSNAYGPDDGILNAAGLRVEDGVQGGCASSVGEYNQHHYPEAVNSLGGGSLMDPKVASSEVRVKREQPEEPGNVDAGKRVQKPALSIEDLLSTLTVNWESPTSESIERFLQRQQEGHDTPVTEDNIFQAFSELVPMMGGGEGQGTGHLMERPQEAIGTTGVEVDHNNVCNSTTLIPGSRELNDEHYDHTQPSLFSLHDML